MRNGVKTGIRRQIRPCCSLPKILHPGVLVNIIPLFLPVLLTGVPRRRLRLDLCPAKVKVPPKVLAYRKKLLSRCRNASGGQPFPHDLPGQLAKVRRGALEGLLEVDRQEIVPLQNRSEEHTSEL